MVYWISPLKDYSSKDEVYSKSYTSSIGYLDCSSDSSDRNKVEDEELVAFDCSMEWEQSVKKSHIDCSSECSAFARSKEVFLADYWGDDGMSQAIVLWSGWRKSCPLTRQHWTV